MGTFLRPLRRAFTSQINAQVTAAQSMYLGEIRFGAGPPEVVEGQAQGQGRAGNACPWEGHKCFVLVAVGTTVPETGAICVTPLRRRGIRIAKGAFTLRMYILGASYRPGGGGMKCLHLCSPAPPPFF